MDERGLSLASWISLHLRGFSKADPLITLIEIRGIRDIVSQGDQDLEEENVGRGNITSRWLRRQDVPVLLIKNGTRPRLLQAEAVEDMMTIEI